VEGLTEGAVVCFSRQFGNRREVQGFVRRVSIPELGITLT
jgi:hypothetical protein